MEGWPSGSLSIRLAATRSVFSDTRQARGERQPRVKYWQATEAESFVWFNDSDLENPARRLDLYVRLRDYGIVFFRDVCHIPGSLEIPANYFRPARINHFGTPFDIRSLLQDHQGAGANIGTIVSNAQALARISPSCNMRARYGRWMATRTDRQQFLSLPESRSVRRWCIIFRRWYWRCWKFCFIVRRRSPDYARPVWPDKDCGRPVQPRLPTCQSLGHLLSHRHRHN